MAPTSLSTTNPQPIEVHIARIQHDLDKLKVQVETASAGFGKCAQSVTRIIADCRHGGRDVLARMRRADGERLFSMGCEALQALALSAQVEFAQFEPNLKTLRWSASPSLRKLSFSDTTAARFAILALDMDELYATNPDIEEYLDIAAEIFELCSGAVTTVEFGDEPLHLPAVLACGGAPTKTLFECVAMCLSALARSHSAWFAKGTSLPKVQLFDQVVPGTGLSKRQTPTRFHVRNPCKIYETPQERSKRKARVANNAIKFVEANTLTKASRKDSVCSDTPREDLEIWLQESRDRYMQATHYKMEQLLALPVEDMLSRVEAAFEIIGHSADVHIRLLGILHKDFGEAVSQFSVQAFKAILPSTSHFFNLQHRPQKPVPPFRPSKDRGPSPPKAHSRELRRWAILRGLDDLYTTEVRDPARLKNAKDVLTFCSGTGLQVAYKEPYKPEEIRFAQVKGANVKWREEALGYARLALDAVAEFMEDRFKSWDDATEIRIVRAEDSDSD